MIEINKGLVIKAAQDYAFNILSDDFSGHDYEHVFRVAQVAELMSQSYECDRLSIILAAYLHDVDDPKIFNQSENKHEHLNYFFSTVDLSEERKNMIVDIIDFITYNNDSKASREGKGIEVQIVQDSDNLDAIGAIGIARLFAYGGAKGKLIYSSDASINDTSLIHYYNHLLNIQDIINTPIAKEMAKSRFITMQKYFEMFIQEIHIIKK